MKKHFCIADIVYKFQAPLVSNKSGPRSSFLTLQRTLFLNFYQFVSARKIPQGIRIGLGNHLKQKTHLKYFSTFSEAESYESEGVMKFLGKQMPRAENLKKKYFSQSLKRLISYTRGQPRDSGNMFLLQKTSKNQKL